MPDRLDDLLHHLPVETMSTDLPARIHLRLQAERSRQRRAQLGLDAVMAVLVIGGVLALAPSLAGATGWLTGGSVESSMAWASRLGSAPAPVVWDTMTAAVDWVGRLADGFGITGLLGLVLLSVPLFTWLRRLMPEAGAASDPAGDWSGQMLEEGVGA
jgi:hypothetical protein